MCHPQSGLKEVIKDDSGLEVRIYYLECLAQATYLLTHEENAFIIDPRRDVDAFIIVSLIHPYILFIIIHFLF